MLRLVLKVNLCLACTPRLVLMVTCVCLVFTPGIFRLVLKVTCLSCPYGVPQAFKTSFDGNPCLVCTLGVQD